MTRVLLIGLATLLLSACTSIDELKSTKTYTPKVMRSGAVNVAARATGITSNRVGDTTILTLPVGRIKTRGDSSANIMKSIGNALTAAGYNAEGNSDYTSADAAYLHAHVESVEFGNFLLFSWGDMIIHLRLETRDGALLWKKRERIRTDIRLHSYDHTAIIAMNRLVKTITKAFSKNDFYQATLRVKRHNDFLKEEIPSERVQATQS